MAVRDYVAKYLADLTGYKIEPAIRDTEELDRASDKTADQVVSDWRRMGAAAKSGGDKITHEADTIGRKMKGKFRGAGREAGAELTANIGEGVSSGKVNVEDAIYGTVGGLATAFPVAGPILAIGGALITGIIAGAKADAERLRALGSATFEAMRDGVLDASEKESILTSALGVESFEQALPKLQTLADQAKIPVKDVYDYIMSGGRNSSAAIVDAFGKVRTASDFLSELDRGGSPFGPRADQAETVNRMGTIAGYAKDVASQTGIAAKNLDTMSRIVGDTKWATVVAATRPGARDAGQVPYATGGRG